MNIFAYQVLEKDKKMKIIKKDEQNTIIENFKSRNL